MCSTSSVIPLSIFLESFGLITHYIPELSSKKQPCHICVVSLEVCKDKNSTKRQAQKQAGKETKEGIFLLCCFSAFAFVAFCCFCICFCGFCCFAVFLLGAATTPPRGCHGPCLLLFAGCGVVRMNFNSCEFE